MFISEPECIVRRLRTVDNKSIKSIVKERHSLTLLEWFKPSSRSENGQGIASLRYRVTIEPRSHGIQYDVVVRLHRLHQPFIRDYIIREGLNDS